jgi:MFS family permease
MEMMLLGFIMPLLTQEWNLTGWEPGSLGMFTFLGMFFGALSWGIISDRYGRRIAYIGSISMVAIAGLASGFTPHSKAVGFPYMLFMRFWVGFGMGGGCAGFTLFSEVCPSKVRGLYLVICQGLFWSISACFSAALGWLVIPALGWRAFLIGSACPAILLVLMFPFLSESPVWLVKNARVDEARQILEGFTEGSEGVMPQGTLMPPPPVAEKNRGLIRVFGNPRWLAGAEAPYLTIEEEQSSSCDDQKPLQIGKLLVVDPQTLKLTVQLILLWMINTLVYYGVVFITPLYFKGPGSGSNTMYIDALITTSAELPGIFVAGGGIDKFGRRNMQTVLLTICGIATAGVLLGRDTQPHCPNGMRNHLSSAWICMFIFLSRMAINGAFASTYVYTPEVYPTAVRNTAIGLFSSAGRVAGMITSATAESLCVVNVCVLYSAAALLGAVLAYTLPREVSGKMYEDTSVDVGSNEG